MSDSDYIKKGQLWRAPIGNGRYEYYIVEDSMCVDEDTGFYYGVYPPGTDGINAWGVQPDPSPFTNFNVLEERDIKRVDYNKRPLASINSIPYFSAAEGTKISDVPIVDGHVFSYTIGELIRDYGFDNSIYGKFYIEKKYVKEVECSGDYTYVMDGNYCCFQDTGSGFSNAQVYIDLNQEENLSDAKLFHGYPMDS